MKKILLAAAAALTLSGCILDDEFWDDYDSGYDYPSGDDCDCDDGDYFTSFAAPPSTPAPLIAHATR